MDDKAKTRISIKLKRHGYLLKQQLIQHKTVALENHATQYNNLAYGLLKNIIMNNEEVLHEQPLVVHDLSHDAHEHHHHKKHL